jgi:hypothetical protein
MRIGELLKCEWNDLEPFRFTVGASGVFELSQGVSGSKPLPEPILEPACAGRCFLPGNSLGENRRGMFKLDSEEALLKAFRPKDRKVVELPPKLKLPLLVRDYLAWPHPAGGRVFLVFAVPNGVPTGIVFETSGGAGPMVPHLCEWCHTSGLGTQVGMLTAAVNANRRAGVHVCSDLSCAQKLDDEANRTGTSAVPAKQKLVARMGRFAAEALKIDLTGAGR